jgi:transcription initiation factor TFIIIB Brf1 subunit/transcription initiation factor TFIIB
MERFTNVLNLPFKFQKISKKINIACNNLLLLTSISSPQSKSAGIIYFINIELKSIVSPETISKLSNVSVSSIIKINKTLQENKIQIFNYIKYYLK